MDSKSSKLFAGRIPLQVCQYFFILFYVTYLSKGIFSDVCFCVLQVEQTETLIKKLYVAMTCRQVKR